MEISTLSALVLTVMVLLPGYIFTQTKRRFCVFSETHDWPHSVMDYLCHSLVMLAIAAGVLSLFGEHPMAIVQYSSALDLGRYLVASPVDWGLTILVFPTIAGYLAALVVRFELAMAPYRLVMFATKRLGGQRRIKQFLAPLPSIVEGWDALYLELIMSGPHIVMVHLKNKTTITGTFKSGAATSRHSSYPDLFLSQLVDTPGSDQFVPNPQSNGVFIRGSEISSIYLWQPSLERTDRDHVQGDASTEGGARHVS